MSMSKHQRQALGLAQVRRRVASGKYNAADVKRWEAELGPKVREIVGEDKPAATKAESTTAKKSPDNPKE